MDKKQILETLQMQPLSEEEKSTRHILGRLYGPIATCNSSTRNGRKYNKDLWERALNDDIFKEKIANKSLFLELGHPVDREETDMEKVCACIPEMPKIVDGDLYAYVDILDTRNGQLLKKLCDYGFIPGISSRGSGDIMDNDEVDPETFFLETWDIVQLPAVKDARLAMCEGLDMKSKKLKQALTESYKKASDEDKKAMKEALDNLDISFEEDITDNDIPWAAEDPEEDKVLMEDAEETDEEDIENEPEEILDDEEQVEDESEVEEVEEEPVEEDEELADDSDIEETETYTIEDLKKELDDYDDELEIEFKPIEIDGVEYPVEMLGFDNSEDGKVVISVGYSQEIGDNIDEVEGEEEIEEHEDEVIVAEDEISEEPVEETEEAEDNGDEEVIESLKEMIRQKDLLENEIKDLKSEKTVSDAEVKELQEELDKYKVAFARVSKVAANTKNLESEINSLTEKLNQKDKEIKSLNESQQVKLNEDVNKTAKQIQSLTEKLTSKQKELEDTESKLTEQANVYKQKLNERTEVAKKYKNRFVETLNKYIDFRASMLGVRPAEITNRLNENFTLNDIDSVCETILEDGFYMGTLSIGPNSQAKVKFTESKQNKKANNFDDECFKELLDLADL